MSKLILLNDVHTELDDSGLITGTADPPASHLGNQQADTIASFLYSKVKTIDFLYNSDAKRILKLVHKLRGNSRDNHLASLDIRALLALRERNFGLLNRSPIAWTSDVFCHSRILAEEGESILQCRTRLTQCISRLCEKHKDKRIVIVSHPFSCQIAFNSLLHKGHTLNTEFWQTKGSFAIFNYTHGKYGIKWELESAFNSLADTSYSTEEIYSRLLGKKGTSADQKA